MLILILISTFTSNTKTFSNIFHRVLTPMTIPQKRSSTEDQRPKAGAQEEERTTWEGLWRLLSKGIITYSLSVFLSFCLSVFPSIYLSVFLSFCLSVYLSFCLSIFLSFFNKKKRWRRKAFEGRAALERYRKIIHFKDLSRIIYSGIKHYYNFMIMKYVDA